MNSNKLITSSPGQTQELGISIGKLAMPGDVYLLTGNLGAGKTCLTQGIARGLGTEEHVMSPTFVLVREMHGRLPVYHIDLYRLDRIEEISDLGLDDYLYGRGVSVIEWAEKGMSVLPAEHLHIKIECIADTERAFEFIPSGDRYRKLVAQLKLTEERE